MPFHRRPRRALALATVAAASAALFASPWPAAAKPPAPAAAYLPPVDAPVVDGFRPPATPFGPGNRGYDYATAPGTPVTAAASGVVVFVGQVGGVLHVVVLHGDGLRTTYSLLADVAVHRGDRVEQGHPVGRAGPRLHFGARRGEDYLDPAELFAQPAGRTRLVPDNGRGLPPEAAERGPLERLAQSLKKGVAASAQALAWLRDGAEATAGAAASAVRQAGDGDLLRLAVYVASQSGAPGVSVVATSVMLSTWARQHGGCTPASTPAPPPLRERRVAVLVAGLGSSWPGHPAILDVPTAALGYAPADRVVFSYRGGRVEENPYRPADTQIDLWVAAWRLRDLLVRVAAEHPGVPVDVFAHSQGGLVARAALIEPPPAVAHLVLLGTPNHGADLADVAVEAVMQGAAPLPALAAAQATKPLGLEPLARTRHDLGTGSGVITDLNRRPPSVPTTSIGARTDWVVPAPRTWLRGAANTVVSAPGLNAHARLPGSAAARRELALAVHGLPPTCETLFEAVLDAVASISLASGEQLAAHLAPPH